VQSGSQAALLTQADSASADFDRFFKAHYCGLARALYRVVGDTQEAEALASEAFWKLHCRAPARGEHLVGWLYRTGFRLALDSLKKRKRRERYEAEAEKFGASPTPLEILEKREREARVRTTLAALKPDHVSLLILRGEGHTLAEIAAILSLQPNSVGTLLARADAALRKEYVKRYGKL
jgi:RNA polymerase sigma-70 factor (ECF subfamily)